LDWYCMVSCHMLSQSIDFMPAARPQSLPVQLEVLLMYSSC
jgi:hypothetical protein